MAITKKVNIQLKLENGIFKGGFVAYRVSDGEKEKSGFNGRIQIKPDEIADIKNKTLGVIYSYIRNKIKNLEGI